MITYFQAIIIGILQGITELFPISSLGHSILLPSLLGWSFQENSKFFLDFLVATHTATALVLFFFFKEDWFKIIGGFFRSLKQREIKNSDADAKLAWLLIVATIPAGIIGLLFEQPIRSLFVSPTFSAIFLTLNGVLLYFAELLRRKSLSRVNDPDKNIAKLSWFQAIKVGTLQVLALFPGFSRTGSTLAGSLMVGLNHEDSIRFSFLLATPIILAASVLKLPDLITPENMPYMGQTLVGAIFAGIFAYISVKFLTKYFENNNLKPFAIYCVLAGLISSILLLVR
ncbi:MAG TPA: undecaprenyl-diphosphate phosphatase [Candidatus Saccharimonadales bacterium]|nr:undecaprenyl-diphosphate phosphatase [Candidatus Saccharimonadales bacterium]